MANWNETNKSVEIGIDEQIIIDKMYGPRIFADIRITPNLDRGWVIERQWISTGEWIEWCTIPGQFNEEFLSCLDSGGTCKYSKKSPK